MNLNALQKAAQILNTESAFKLYIYFAKNQDKYTFALSSKDFMYWSGMSKNAYDKGFQMLVDKKYLIKRNDTNQNIYDFYDMPQEPVEEETIVTINKS